MMINSFLLYVRSPAPLTMYHDAYNTLPIRRETRKIFLKLGFQPFIKIIIITT